MRLEGRVALVIGGASGLGRASAQACADDGARVMIADLNAQSGREAAAAIGRNGGTASFVEVDATDEESVRAGVEATVREFGNLEILVNSAGGGAPASDEREPWHFVIDIFLKAPYYACKYAIPEMERAGRGAIVNIGARARARRVPSPLGAAPSGSRGARSR